MSFDTIIANAVDNFHRNTQHLYSKTVEEDFIKIANLLAPIAFSKKNRNYVELAKVFLGLQPLCVINGGTYSMLQNALSRNDIFNETVDITDTLYGRRVTREEEEICVQLESDASTLGLFIQLCHIYGLVVLNTYNTPLRFLVCWKNNMVDALILRDMTHGNIELPSFDSSDKNSIFVRIFSCILQGDELELIEKQCTNDYTISQGEIRELLDSSVALIIELRKKYSI